MYLVPEHDVNCLRLEVLETPYLRYLLLGLEMMGMLFDISKGIFLIERPSVLLADRWCGQCAICSHSVMHRGGGVTRRNTLQLPRCGIARPKLVNLASTSFFAAPAAKLRVSITVAIGLARATVATAASSTHCARRAGSPRCAARLSFHIPVAHAHCKSSADRQGNFLDRSQRTMPYKMVA